ncbi:hypothetical protein DRN44_08285 [Thermococci archaeon]|nr:MAG: hypothetical protein DRN44_08285 [Thermococci archaeon]
MLTRIVHTPRVITSLRENNLSITLIINPGRISVRKVEIKAEVKGLKESNLKVRDELQGLLKALNDKADKDDLKDVRLRLNSLIQTLDSLIMKMEGLEISLQRDQILADDEDKKELVIRLIREGYNTPKGLKSMVPFGNKKLYEIPTELEREGLTKTLKKKRKVYYITEAEVY